jgi:hypothetical protein
MASITCCKELHNLSYSQLIIIGVSCRKMGWDVAHSMHSRDKKCWQHLNKKKSKMNRSLRRPRHTKDNNIKMDLKSCDDVELIHVSEPCSVAGSCEHGNEPPGSRKGTTVNRRRQTFSMQLVSLPPQPPRWHHTTLQCWCVHSRSFKCHKKHRNYE